jgi:hypothetical protein
MGPHEEKNVSEIAGLKPVALKNVLRKSKRPISKEEVIRLVRELAKKLGRAPSTREVEIMTPVTRQQIRRRFGNLTNILRACELGKPMAGLRIPTSALFRDWATVARKLKKLPSAAEFNKLGKHSVGAFQRLCAQWSAVPRMMFEYAEEKELESQWGDVVNMMRDRLRNGGATNPDKWPLLASGHPRIKRDRPVYGPAMLPTTLMHIPTNEAGVMFLFATMALQMGFMATIVRSDFPDCEALREIEPSKWQRVLIEFEYESRNFLKHGHKVKECDLIVCWEHNWPECPLEVIELKKVVERMTLMAVK